MLIEEKMLMLDLHNNERGSSTLILNQKLEEAAQDHAENMAKRRRLTHSGLSKRVKDTGYKFRNVGENIAAGQTSVEQVMKSWLRSRGHARNIRGGFTEVGFGRSGNYWCVIFATPLN